MAERSGDASRQLGCLRRSGGRRRVGVSCRELAHHELAGLVQADERRQRDVDGEWLQASQGQARATTSALKGELEDRRGGQRQGRARERLGLCSLVALLLERRERELGVLHSQRETGADRIALDQAEVGEQRLAREEAGERLRAMPYAIRPGRGDEERRCAGGETLLKGVLVCAYEGVGLARQLVVEGPA